MAWGEMIFGIVPYLVEAFAWYAAARGGPDQARPYRSRLQPEVDPDDWKCPDFAEVARVLGTNSGPENERRVLSWPQGHARARSPRPERHPQPHPDDWRCP